MALLEGIGLAIADNDTLVSQRDPNAPTLYLALLASALALETGSALVIASVLPLRTVARTRVLAALARFLIGIVISVPVSGAVFCLLLVSIQTFQAM
jgi:ABC-type amino acid transport system permease subunit